MLEVKNLSKRYGGVRALHDVSLAFKPGQVTGVIGPNGAGKTTMFDTVTGFVSADGGRVTFGGHRIDGLNPAQIARRGVVRTFQEVRVFDSMTVPENLYVGRHARRYRDFVRNGARRVTARRLGGEAGTVSQVIGERDRGTVAGDLSFGERKRMEYFRLLASGAEALLLDEPASGLDESVMRDLAAMIRAAANDGHIVGVIEHNMEFVREICDEVYVLHLGELIAHGSAAEVLADDRVRRVYLGRDAAAP